MEHLGRRCNLERPHPGALPLPEPMAPVTSRRKLHPETIPRAQELAAMGLPLASIAAALGVHRSTLAEWRATEPALADAIHRGHHEGEAALVRRLHAGDERSAQWLLTHSPQWRNSWSDAAALRRELQRHAGKFMAALQASNLPPELERQILLNCAAQGLGICEQDRPG